ncbi:MAG: hypothetical protein ACLQVY_04285 [Limisphaerales bacterium]
MTKEYFDGMQWCYPSSLWFRDAKNMVSFVDGHGSYIKIHWAEWYNSFVIDI